MQVKIRKRKNIMQKIKQKTVLYKMKKNSYIMEN